MTLQEKFYKFLVDNNILFLYLEGIGIDGYAPGCSTLNDVFTTQNPNHWLYATEWVNGVPWCNLDNQWVNILIEHIKNKTT